MTDMPNFRAAVRDPLNQWIKDQIAKAAKQINQSPSES